MADENKAFEPTQEDFDSWSDEKEEQALADIAETFKVKHCIGDSTLFIKSASGNVYRLPLNPSYSQVAAIQQGGDDEAMDRLCDLIASGRGGKESAEKFKAEPMQTMVAALTLYGEILPKAQGVSLGE